MPNIVMAVIGVAVIVTIATALDWLISHPIILILGAAAIGGAIFLAVRSKRSANRV